MGTGLFYLNEAYHDEFSSFMLGGTGASDTSIQINLPWPSVVEGGNMNIAALAAWHTGMIELDKQAADLKLHRKRLLVMLLDILKRSTLFDVIGHQGDKGFVEVVSVICRDPWTCHDLAALMDSQYGIEVRSGYHCAPLIHRGLPGASMLGETRSNNLPGTLRFSLGHTSTIGDIEQLSTAILDLESQLKAT
jgi:cysteine desulfurase / selenocysteine lyase